MQRHNNLTLIGTSHISKDSVKEIRKEVAQLKPDMMAVELDAGRLAQLMSDEQAKFSYSSMFRVGFFGFIFALIGKFAQQKLGKIVGMDPGSEMKETVLLAKKEKIPLKLIDQNIQITLQRFSKAFTWREGFQIVTDIVQAIFKKGKKMPFDIKRVPSKQVINMMLDEMKVKYPNIHKVLVEERNYVMASRLIALIRANPEKKIIAVVGAGHEDEMIKIIRRAFPKIKSDDNSISFSFSVNAEH